MQQSRTVFLSHLDLLVPDLVEAARLLEREGVIDGMTQVPQGTTRPTGVLLIVPKDKIGQARITDALLTLSEATGLVFRSDDAKPVWNEAYARQQGFSEQEIQDHLKPWIAERAQAASANVIAKKKAYDAAVAEAAMSYEATQAKREAELDATDAAGAAAPASDSPPAA